MSNIAAALSSLRPGATWEIRGDVTYENIVWLDQQATQPSKAEVTAEVARLSALRTQAQAHAAAGALVMAMLNDLANAWQYTDYHSARTYRGDSNAKYAAEAEAIATFGSACFAVLDDIAAGVIPQPADGPALMRLLPAAPVRPTGA